MANTPQTFATKFRMLTPEKLAEIIAREEDYHPDAVSAARLELTVRMLPADELDRIYDLAEVTKAKSDSDGTRLGVGMNPKVEAIKKTFNKKTKSSIWGRTNILKLIFGYLLYSSFISFYYFMSNFFFTPISISGMDNHLTLSTQLLDPLIWAVLIVLGLKGYKAAWWGTTVFFALGFLGTISNAANTYMHYTEYAEQEGLALLLAQLTDDPYTAAGKLALAAVALYLILRKDTRIACGITKGEAVKMDELDHLI